jgi:hypothetical protein
MLSRVFYFLLASNLLCYFCFNRLNPASQAYKISKDGQPIGAVIVWIRENNVNFLGNIFIDPKFQDKGLGLKVWKFIESKYPDTVKWYTDTPVFSKRNIIFM